MSHGGLGGIQECMQRSYVALHNQPFLHPLNEGVMDLKLT